MMKFLYALLVALLLAATNVVSASVALSEDPASEVALPLDISSEDLASIKLPDGLDFAITKLIQDAIYVKNENGSGRRGLEKDDGSGSRGLRRYVPYRDECNLCGSDDYYPSEDVSENCTICSLYFGSKMCRVIWKLCK